MTLTLDSNILVYAVQDDEARSPTARRIIAAAPATGMVFTAQVFGEFLNVVRRKHPLGLPEAAAIVTSLSAACPVLGTATAHLLDAVLLAETRRLQFWDSVILTVADAAGIRICLTEDMQDGATFGDVRLINPFAAANAPLLADLLTPAPGTA